MSKLVKNTCNAIRSSTQIEESQYPGRKLMSSSHVIEKQRALQKDQELVNAIQCLKIEIIRLVSGQNQKHQGALID